MKKVLSQEEIDAVFQNTPIESIEPDSSAIGAFDLSHLDRIPKSQLKALHTVHEDFVRSLGSSLSAYLRSYVALNLVSLEQISYSEFQDGLSFPTCIAYIGMSPYEGTAVLELNMTLMFTFLELMMGAKARVGEPVQRKITDIEKSIIQTLLRVVLKDLREAWRSVTDVDFEVQSLASEPQLVNVLAPSEAVIVIAVDARIGDVTGLLNIAIPSIFIKRLRTRFEQLQNVRRVSVTERDQAQVAEMLKDVSVRFTASIEGGNVHARILADLEPGQVLVLDASSESPVLASINGVTKWKGAMRSRKGKLVFEASEEFKARRV